MIELMEHQRRFQELAATSPLHSRHLLEWDPGVGKTVAVLSHVDGAKRRGFVGKTLIVAPLSVLRNAWEADARRYFPDLKVVVCWHPTAAKRRKLIATPDADVLVINPDGFKTLYRPWNKVDHLSSLGIRRMIFDESDALTNAATWISKRNGAGSGSDISLTTYLFSQTVEEFFALSGTPTDGNEADYYGQLRAVDPHLLGNSWHRFVSTWFDPVKVRVGWKPKPAVAALAGSQQFGQRPDCLRHPESLGMMSWACRHLADPESRDIHFASHRDGYEMRPSLTRIVPLFTDQRPKARYTDDETRRIMKWFASRFADYDERERLFDPVEAIKNWKLKEDRKPEFYEKIKSRVWIIKRDDVLDLPPETDCVRDVYLSREEWEVYETVRSHAQQEVKLGGAIIADPDDGGDLASIVKVGPDLKGSFVKVRQVPGGTLIRNGRAIRVGRSKLDCLLELLDELGSHRVVVFAEFSAEIDLIMEALSDRGSNVARYDGSVKQVDRDAAIDSFWKGGTQYIVAQPQAISHGTNLQCARYDVYYSLGFNSRRHKQCRARIYRNGQKEAVTHYYLIAQQTSDQKAYEVVMDRMTEAEAIKEILATRELEAVA